MEHKCKKPDIKTVEKCELKRDEIIKALECCTRPDNGADCPLNCPYGDVLSCQQLIMVNALSLIKELTEKYENLEMQFREIDHECDRLEIRNEELTEENERLSAYNENLIKENTYLSNHLLDEVEQAKDIAIVDTLSELKIRLTREVGTYLSISIMKVSDMFKLIDQIAKEIIGGSK